MLGKRILTLAAVGVLALSGTGYALYRDQQAERRPLPAPLSLPSSSSPASETSSIPPSVLGDTTSQDVDPASESAFTSLTLTESPLLRLRWQENAREQLANGDFIIKPDGVLALARRAVGSGELGRHVIEADDIDSHSITSRTIRDKTVASDDLADVLSLGDVTIREGLAVSGDATLAGDLDVAGVITGSFAGAFAPSGDVDMAGHILTNIGNNGTDFTATGGLTLADTLTVSGGGASITGTLTLPSLTEGSIPFIGTGGALSEDPTNLYWDGTNHRLGIGTTTPSYTLDISGTTRTSNLLSQNLILSSSAASILTSSRGFNGYTNFSGGLGTGGSDSLTPALRLTHAGNFVNIGSYQGGEMSLTSAGTFADKVDYATGTGPYSVASADFNGDGKPDLATANTSYNDDTLSVFINNGDGTFAGKVDYATGRVPYGIASADFNGDGKPDLATANTGSDTLSIFINNGDGTFAGKVDYATGRWPQAVVSADLNGDGKPDLAVANSYGNNTLSVFINNGDGTFAAKTDYTTGTGPYQYSIASADFNGDGKPDLVTADNGNNTVSVLLNNGDGTFAAKVDYTTGSGAWGVVSADFNGDGRLDLAGTNYYGTTLSVLMNNGDGTFASKVDYATGAGPRFVTSADYNGDGKPDIAVMNGNNNTLSVFINNGDGTFASKVDYATGTKPRGVVSADFNSDGKPDLAVANWNSNTLSVLLNTPQTMFYAQASTGNVGIGDTTPASLFTVGNGDLFQVDSTGNLIKVRNVTYSWPVSQGSASTILTNNGSGTLSWGTLGASSIAADSLDFTEFKDALTLDASTDISITGSNVFSLTNAGTGNSFVVNDQAGDTSPFVIDASGNVGIGTTPAHALDISAADSTSYSSSSSLSDVGSDLLRLYNSDNTADGYAGILMMHRSSNVSFARIAVQGGFYSPGLSAITFGLRGPTGLSINERMRIVDNGNVGIGTTSPGTKLAVAGLTGTSSYNLVRVDTATGNFYYDSSSARYKDDIHPFEEDFSKILDLTVKEYTDKTSRESEIGLIAEELDAAGLSHLVISKDGVPDAIKYDRIPMYLLGVLQAQDRRIADLEADGSGTPTSSVTFDALTARMDILETTSAALMDFYTALSLDMLLMKDVDGHLDLGDGTLLAKKVDVQEIAIDSITVRDREDSPTLGTAEIKAGETEVTVETEAVTEKSRIFVTPEVRVTTPLSVDERSEGESFTVGISQAVGKDIPFSWWIVESGTEAVPATP